MSDRVLRAYAKLKSLEPLVEENKGIHVTENLVREYESALDHLEAEGFDVQEFRIPDLQVQPRVASGNMLTGEVRYSRDRFAPLDLFRAKLGAVLTYFSVTSARDKPRIGFENR